MPSTVKKIQPLLHYLLISLNCRQLLLFLTNGVKKAMKLFHAQYIPPVATTYLLPPEKWEYGSTTLPKAVRSALYTMSIIEDGKKSNAFSNRNTLLF